MATALAKRSGSTDGKRPHSRHRYEKVKAKLQRDPRLLRERTGLMTSQYRLSSTRQMPQPHRIPTPVKTPLIYVSSFTPPLDIYNPPAMERTLSGDSIVSDHNIPLSPPTPHDNTILTDDQAANLIQHHIRSNPPSHFHPEKLELQNLLLKAHLSDRAIHRIIYLTDTIFFHRSLHNRVRLSWSSPSQSRYSSELIGTTALRLAPQSVGGFETLIVLSEPILRSPKYDRRLLLSALLHELVHCYLFVKCGFRAKMMGGHTSGFHTVVGVIDRWVERWIGRDWLRLCSMRANLELFRVGGVERGEQVMFRAKREVGRWAENLREGYRERGGEWEREGKRIRLRAKVYHHHHHHHAGCGQSPGPGMERGWGCAGDVIQYGEADEGFR